MIAQRAAELRSLELVIEEDAAHGRVAVLRDTESVAPKSIALPMDVARVAARFDGRRSIEDIARASGKTVAWVTDLADELDRALLLDSPRYRARRAEVVRAFKAAPTRPAAHAGGAYHGEADALAAFIDERCLGRAPSRPRAGRLAAIAAPHMDLWRASAGYGHAYRALADGLAPEVDTFILLGTSHAAMHRPFSVCGKPFETPLGSIEHDPDLVDELARASRFDVFEDQFLHRTEHSLEFQVVFLAHALGGLAAKRRARIVPVLCGLGDAQARARDPAQDRDAESFVDALAGMVDRLGDRAVVVAGADLAHVGPRFGDARPLDSRGRDALARADRQSVSLALAGDAKGFFDDVARDLGTRRVCGLAPLYTMLRALGEPARGELLNYEQHVDPDEGSIVSHTSLAYWR